MPLSRSSETRRRVEEWDTRIVHEELMSPLLVDEWQNYHYKVNCDRVSVVWWVNRFSREDKGHLDKQLNFSIHSGDIFIVMAFTVASLHSQESSTILPANILHLHLTDTFYVAVLLFPLSLSLSPSCFRDHSAISHTLHQFVFLLLFPETMMLHESSMSSCPQCSFTWKMSTHSARKRTCSQNAPLQLEQVTGFPWVKVSCQVESTYRFKCGLCSTRYFEFTASFSCIIIDSIISPEGRVTSKRAPLWYTVAQTKLVTRCHTQCDTRVPLAIQGLSYPDNPRISLSLALSHSTTHPSWYLRAVWPFLRYRHTESI